MNAQTQSVVMSVEKQNKTMIEQFFTKTAQRKIAFLVENKSGVVELADECAATIRCSDGVAEVCTYGSVRWIE